MHKQHNNHRLNKGYTMIEILVVISIIGFVAVVAMYQYNNARAKARDVKRLSDIKTIEKALKMYYDDNGEYPYRPNPDKWFDNDACTDGTKENLSNILPSNYISKIPDDPNNNGVNGCYWYQNRDSGQGYVLLMTPELLDPDNDMGCYGGIYYCIGENW